jgi:hypothetical protein
VRVVVVGGGGQGAGGAQGCRSQDREAVLHPQMPVCCICAVLGSCAQQRDWVSLMWHMPPVLQPPAAPMLYKVISTPFPPPLSLFMAGC